MAEPELWRFGELRGEDFQLYRDDELRHLGGVRVPDGAVERMVEFDLAAIQQDANGDPSFIFDDGLEERLRVRNERRLRAAVGGEGL